MSTLEYILYGAWGLIGLLVLVYVITLAYLAWTGRHDDDDYDGH